MIFVLLNSIFFYFLASWDQKIRRTNEGIFSVDVGGLNEPAEDRSASSRQRRGRQIPGMLSRIRQNLDVRIGARIGKNVGKPSGNHQDVGVESPKKNPQRRQRQKRHPHSQRRQQQDRHRGRKGWREGGKVPSPNFETNSGSSLIESGSSSLTLTT